MLGHVLWHDILHIIISQNTRKYVALFRMKFSSQFLSTIIHDQRFLNAYFSDSMNCDRFQNSVLTV